MARDTINETLVDRAIRAGRIKFKKTPTLKDIGDWAGGVKQPSVSEWRQPGRYPSMDSARTLALKLDVSIDWLYTGREPMFSGKASDQALMRLLDYWPFLDDVTKGEMIGQAAMVARENKAYVKEQQDLERARNRAR